MISIIIPTVITVILIPVSTTTSSIISATIFIMVASLSFSFVIVNKFPNGYSPFFCLFFCTRVMKTEKLS